ncbi:prolipoprotein diacylglyceryl transferase [Cognatilysobacter lacus]|uniref:Phosphatidylglycerol--prolipoprotein diacylglyceryl transferase n=1 Tax=Cognatilysobacter lacus TaxID=1643323 RepID=A0A5D8Z876_9GAMM|nr:prolipoprotein diacylglyceryl transferase [Lysobacter lacus]TZF90293.1 prolipoprotein diacylglyceryl transferase [Lysobacter lacus]
MTYLHDLNPIALSLGPVKVHWYGVAYMLGFMASWYLGRRRIRAGRLPGISEQAFGDMLFYGMLGVVLGGRIGYVLFYAFGDFIHNPLMILRIWEGGMSFHGGLLGVMAGIALWCRRHRLHFMDAMDFVAPLVPPGLGIVRVANFVNGELWGKPTTGPWGVIFPHSLPQPYASMPMQQLRTLHAQGALDVFARHPSQLYQAALEGLFLGLILWAFSSRPRPRYAVGGMFALLYGIQRFAVEFVRVPDEQLGYLAWNWLTMGQLLSLPLIALGLGWLWWSRRQPTLQPVPAAG